MKNCFTIPPTRALMQQKVNNFQAQFFHFPGQDSTEQNQKFELKKIPNPTKLKEKSKRWKKVENGQKHIKKLSGI